MAMTKRRMTTWFTMKKRRILTRSKGHPRQVAVSFPRSAFNSFCISCCATRQRQKMKMKKMGRQNKWYHREQAKRLKAALLSLQQQNRTRQRQRQALIKKRSKWRKVKRQKSLS